MKEKGADLFKVIIGPVLALAGIAIPSGEFIDKLATVAGIAMLVPILVEWAKVKFELSGVKWWFMGASKWLAFIFGIALMYLSYYFGFGFEAMNIWVVGFWGVIIAISANGWFKYIEIPLAKIYERLGKLERMEEIERIKGQKG
jgi:hypothetical protein